jgi:hypothetical protein
MQNIVNKLKLIVRFLPVGWIEPRNPTISVFEARSIAIEEHLYILSGLSIDYLVRETQQF